MKSYTPRLDLRLFYDHFDAPVTGSDCGTLCAPHNPAGKPFCCDICHAVPVAFKQEWQYLQKSTDLWHLWRGDECLAEPTDPASMQADTPDHLLLLACKGPAYCQREYRASSCRQFPFFPYITSDDRFIGLAYEWDFEPVCWVISHLDAVTPRYRQEFIATYDDLFSRWPDEYESYAATSEEIRAHFQEQKRRIPILHRNGKNYLVSPAGERMRLASAQSFRQFGPYRQTRLD